MPAHAPTILINLISDRPAHIAKALRFGRKFLADGTSVILSVNIDAVVLVDPERDAGRCPVTGKPLTDLLRAFAAEGGRVLVGRECLGLIGRGPEDLPAGCEIAAFPLMAEIFATPDLKTITW
ncbi:hypothetical protein KDM41_16280 [bacterium]|nr:hypothetical protein [bacterium]